MVSGRGDDVGMCLHHHVIYFGRDATPTAVVGVL